MNKVDDWTSGMLQGDNLAQWAENMLLDWHENDPLSQKEIDRNNAVYDIQENRNPFIDHPEWVYSIWGPTASIDEPAYLSVKISYFNHSIRIEREVNSTGELKIINYLGQTIMKQIVNSEYEEVDFKCKPGIYIIVFTSPEEYSSKKILF